MIGSITLRSQPTLFDVIAIGPNDVRLLQVKAGTKYLSGEEREQILAIIRRGIASRPKISS